MTDDSVRAFFWACAAVTLVTLLAAIWCSSLPNGHYLGLLAWPLTVVLMATCAITAIATTARSETPVAARAWIVAVAVVIVGTFVGALGSDLVKTRWHTAESAFDRAAPSTATAPGSTDVDRWIAGYPVREISRDTHDNVYFTVSGTGLLCSDSGFAKLPAYADRASTPYQYYVHLHDDWYYWLPKTGMCEA